MPYTHFLCSQLYSCLPIFVSHDYVWWSCLCADAPSIAGRVPPGVAGAMGRSMSAPRDVSGMQDDFSGAPARSAGEKRGVQL